MVSHDAIEWVILIPAVFGHDTQRAAATSLAITSCKVVVGAFDDVIEVVVDGAGEPDAAVDTVMNEPYRTWNSLIVVRRR